MTGPSRRRVFFEAVATAAALFLWSVPVLAQGVGGVACFAFPCQATVASLPTPDGTQGVRVVLDGSTATDCTVGGGAEIVLCMDTGAAWEAVGGSAGTDDQTAVEVPYTPTTPGDWTDPDPAEVLTGLDDLASRLTAKEAETLAGDVTGPPSATVVGDDSHAHTTTTVSGLDTSDVTTGTWADARVSQSSVTQHQAALSITESQVSDLTHFAPAAGISTDHGAGAVSALTDLAATLCGTGEVLEDQGASWACIATPTGGGAPGGSDSQVQYNDGGALGGDADLTWDVAGKRLALGAVSTSSRLVLPSDPDRVTPTLGFGDGDSGIHEIVEDGIALVVNGSWVAQARDGVLKGIFTNGRGSYFLSPLASTGIIPSLGPAFDDQDTGLGSASFDDLRLIAAGVSAYGVTSTKLTSYVARADAPQSLTCADSGDANPGSLTLIPTTSNVQITNNDADGCDVTLSESGAVDGQVLRVVVVASVGGTVNFADTAAVSELSGAFAAGVWDTLTVSYVIDRWVENSRSGN